MTATLEDILLDADAANKKAAPEPVRVADDLGEALIAHKLALNTFVLDLNHGLTTPYEMELEAPWNLPSRMFRFPIEVTSEMDGLPRRIGLVHPLLVDHPFVLQVQETLGIEIEREGAPNPHGWRTGKHAEWWHAVDLVTAGRWKDLLETERFTTPHHIAGAVAHGLAYSPYEGKKRNGHLTTMEARKILAHIGAPEPGDKPELLRQFMRPSPCEKRWPINMVGRGGADLKAWAHVIGIEEGWFAYDRSGYLGWSAKGREMFVEVEVSVAPEFNAVQKEPVEIEEEQLVEEIEETPAAVLKPKQLDLF